MRYFVFVAMTMVMASSSLVACVPLASKTTTTKTVAHSSSSFEDSFSLDECEKFESTELRKRCFVDVLVLSRERIRELEQSGQSSDRLRYWHYVSSDASARLAALEEAHRSVWNVKKADTIMDVYICEMCPTVRHFVRDVPNPEEFPLGWALNLVKGPSGNTWLELHYGGVTVGVMDKPFTHYEVQYFDDGTFTIEVVEGKKVSCGEPLVI